MPSDLPEGVTTKTTRLDLIKLLQEARDKLHKQEAAELDTLKQMEESLRKRWKPRAEADPLHQVILSASETEWAEALLFLGDVEDILPAALARLYVGGQVMFEDAGKTPS